MPDKLRRIVTVLLALTLVVGLMPNGVRAVDAGMTMVIAAGTDMPMSDPCDGCGAQKANTSAACSAHCSSIVGLFLTGTAFEPASADVFAGFAAPTLPDRTIPPDPYPPRPAVLS